MHFYVAYEIPPWIQSSHIFIDYNCFQGYLRECVADNSAHFALGVSVSPSLLLTAGPVVSADDSSAPPDQNKVVQIKSGNAIGALKVLDANPYKNLHVPPPGEKYDPRNYSMNQTSSMANKQFSADNIAISKSGSSIVHDQTSFATKSYTPNAMTAQNLDTKFATPTTSEATHGDSFFYKDYPTTSSSLGNNSSKSFTSTSPDQDRTASIGDKKSDVHNSDLAKQYLGPGAQHVPDGPREGKCGDLPCERYSESSADHR